MHFYNNNLPEIKQSKMFSHPDTTPESILTEATDMPEWSPLSEVASTQQGLWSQKFFDPLIGEEESI